MKDKRYAVNGRSRGLVAIPVGEIPTGTRCVSVNIPDSDDAVKMLAGMLYELTHWSNFAREASHKGTLWAQAWREALLASIPFGGCGVSIEFMQDDCGLYFREVGQTEWTQIYDGLYCLQSDGAQQVIRDAFSDFIDQMFDDGTLQRPGGQPGPADPPAENECKTYHVILQANQQWLLPQGLGYGDQITVGNVHGGWCDGTLAWYCPDGARYLASVCAEELKTHQEGDVLNPGAYHMALVMRVDETWYAAPLSTFTQESAANPLQVVFQANDGSLSDDSGNIEFDVTVCSGATGVHTWDFAYGPNDWASNPRDGSGWGATWAAGHWTSGAFALYLTIPIGTDPTCHITSVVCEGVAGTGTLSAQTDYHGVVPTWWVNAPSTGNDVDTAGSGGEYLVLQGNGLSGLSKITIHFSGPDPFGG